MLQKTIDYIRHLENTIRRLQEENHTLKDTLAKGETHKGMMLFVWNVYTVDDVRP